MSIAIVDHALPYDTHNLYDVSFYTHNIHTLLTSSPSMVDSWLSETPNLHSLPQPLIVGLDVEWRPNFHRNMENPVAILQLCVGPRCLIFQILHAPKIPQSLINFLANANHTFVGVGIEEDVEKLVCDYELSVATFVDLRDLAVDQLGDNELKKSGLKTLALRVLGKEIEKPKSISRSRWDNLWLTPEQVKYACIDAFISFEVARLLYSGQL
ncbi:Werner Syndrome-like exonuclease [Neltuma alba]|uniref:Werner Syndrome-like exonuclease n=1 Tax=Neltuma alba TaxID=207710 RepID=UPI0010A4986F|nr:Werner Syndrome-like exonuclease [Prosopis alba]